MPMLTAQDIKKITAVVATKKDVATLDKRIVKMEVHMADIVTHADLAVFNVRMSGAEMKLSVLGDRFVALEERMTKLEDRIDRLISSVDKLASFVNNLHTEYSFTSLQISRHEEWIKKIAEHTGVKLDA